MRECGASTFRLAFVAPSTTTGLRPRQHRQPQLRSQQLHLPTTTSQQTHHIRLVVVVVVWGCR